MPRTIAVIGHGRSPEGRRWGQRIDRCTVVRMWDCAWQPADDYGTRYDYGFFEAHPSMMAAFWEHAKRAPSEGWIASALGRIDRCRLPQATELIYQQKWNEIGKQLGGIGATGQLQFTRGTITACWAIERSGPGDQVVLVGFDNIYNGRSLPLAEAFCPEYIKNPGTFTFARYRGGEVKHGNHDFTIERPVMEYLAQHNSVRLAFAQDIWKCREA